jgi:hypothetical protein
MAVVPEGEVRVYAQCMRTVESVARRAAAQRLRTFAVQIVMLCSSTYPGPRAAHALDCTRAVTTTEQLLCRERGGKASGSGEVADPKTPATQPGAATPAKKAQPPGGPRGYSARDVWLPHDTGAWLGTLIQCDWKDACVSKAMAAAGASPGAVAIARAQGFNGYLTEFEEGGRVDTGRVRLEYTARPGTACYALNGAPPAIDLGAEIAQDAELRAAIKSHPQFNPLQWRYQDAHPDNRGAFRILAQQATVCTASASAEGQEFQVGLGMGGCEDCEPGGYALVAVDFDRNGRMMRKRLLALAEEPPAQSASVIAGAPAASQLKFPEDRPAVQARLDVEAEPLQRLLRRVVAEKALERQDGEVCELGALRALGAVGGQQVAAKDRRALAAEVLQSARANAPADNGVGDFLLGLGRHAAGAALPGVAVSAALAREVAERIGGYVAAKAVAGYIAGATGEMDEELVARLLRDEGLSVWTLNGTDATPRTQRTEDARAANVTALLYYNPYTRYATAVAGSSCAGAGGAPDRRLYRLHYEVTPDSAQSADYVPGTVTWQEIIAGP